MKDNSRPHPASPSRSAPYRKRKQSGNVSPAQSTRRTHDLSPPRAHSSRRQKDPLGVISTPDDHRRSVSKKGGKTPSSPRARRNSNTDGSARERKSHAGSALSTHASDAPGPLLRLPITPVPPVASIPAGQSKTESPPPGSVTAFLRSIELPEKSSSDLPVATAFPFTPPSLRIPPVSTDCSEAKRTDWNDHQVSLFYKGYPFTYDLATLSDDPKGTIALLTITRSDPGAYLLVGAHYRRTGRSRAACAVIRSLLDNLNIDRGPSNTEKEDGDVTAVNTDDSTVLPCSGLPDPESVRRTTSVYKGAALRPALLLLAACELDISREHPDDPESDDHASTAHELFRTVYGIVNDDIVAGAVRLKPGNALGLEFSSNRNLPSISTPKLAPTFLARVKELEKELSVARASQKTLEEELAVCNDRLTSAEDKVRTLESRSREMVVQLDASRDENWELRRRLAESEQKAREVTPSVQSAESRVWGKLKDLLFDNLGGGMRGE